MLKLCSKAAFVWRNISSNSQLMKVRRFGLEGKTECKDLAFIARDDKEEAINVFKDYFKELSLELLPGTKFPGIVENLPRIDAFKELEKFGIKTNQRGLLLGNTFEKAALALAKDNYKEGLTIESVEQKIHEWNDAEKARDKMIEIKDEVLEHYATLLWLKSTKENHKEGLTYELVRQMVFELDDAEKAKDEMQEIKTEKLEYFAKLLTSSFAKHHGLIFLIDGVPRVSECPEQFQGEQRKELHTLNSTVFCILGQKCVEIYEIHPLELDYFKQNVESKEMKEKDVNLTFVRLLSYDFLYNMNIIAQVFKELNECNGDD